jgi:hypothetical protein
MKATRRDFIKAATVTSGLMMTGVPAIAVAETKPKQAQSIGVALQLCSVSKDCAKDFDKTLAKAAAMGVTGVEFAGFFKYANNAKGLKKQLDANGLKVAGTLSGAGGEFLGAAERYNRLPNIDRWVVKTVFETLGKWAKVLEDQYICWGINLTGQSLAGESFLQFVEEQIRSIDFPAKWVYFEITESVAIRNIEQVKDFVSRIKTLGCNFALDDFGTGYSSYEYLKNLPTSYLKIDGSFIRNLNNDPFNQLTVHLLITYLISING